MPAGYKQLSTMNKGQRGLLQQLLGGLQGQSSNIQQSPLFQQGSSFLQNLLSGSPEATAAFEAPYMRQFNEQIVPGLAERFSGLGAGAQRSSAFSQALGAAGAGLNENLASLQQQYNLQNRGFDQNLLGMLLGQGSQPSFENLFRPREAGFLENSANKLVDYLPTILGALFGIPLPPAGGGGQQQQGGGLFQLSGGLGGGNNGYGFGSENGFQFPNLAQQFGQTRFNNF